MKRIALLTIAVVTVACLLVFLFPASGHAHGEATPIYVTHILPGYRDWKVISVAHEEGNLNSLGVIRATIPRSKPGENLLSLPRAG